MKKVFLALFVMVMMASCNTFKIKVNLENSDGKTVYLERYVGEEMNILDSVVAKNNKASFKVMRSDNLDALHIMMDGWRRPLAFFADNKNVKITGDYQNYNGINVMASESQNKINDLIAEADKIEDEKELYFFIMDYVKQNIDNPTGSYVLYRYKWAYSLDDLLRLYEGIPVDLESGYKYQLAQYIKGLAITDVGQSFLDFKQNTINGNYTSLSRILKESKVVILDFWASWCPDCRKANPELVDLYTEFNDKGLDIVSVSLDTKEDAWKKAIIDDNLCWENHFSDLKGWDNEIAKMYTIAFIPQNFVIDQNGMIIGKNMKKCEIKELLVKILE